MTSPNVLSPTPSAAAKAPADLYAGIPDPYADVRDPFAAPGALTPPATTRVISQPAPVFT